MKIVLNASTAQTYFCTLQRYSIIKSVYQYIQILCKSIINNKNNQENMFVTFIDTRLVTL